MKRENQLPNTKVSEKIKVVGWCLIGFLASISIMAYIILSIYIFLNCGGFHDNFFLMFFCLLTVVMGVLLIIPLIMLLWFIRKIIKGTVKTFKPVKRQEWTSGEKLQTFLSGFLAIFALLFALLFIIISVIIFIVIIFNSDYDYDLLMIVFIPALISWLAIIVTILLLINTRFNTFYISAGMAYVIPWLYVILLAWSYEDFFSYYGFMVIIYEGILILLSILQLYHCIKNKNVSRETFKT